MAQDADISNDAIDRCIVVFFNIKLKDSHINRTFDSHIIKNLHSPTLNKLLIPIDRVQCIFMLTTVMGVYFGYIPLNV